MSKSRPEGEPILSIKDLNLAVSNEGSQSQPIVSGVSFDIHPSEIACIVGESGSGKSITALSLMGLMPPALNVESGQILFEGSDISSMSERELQDLRGSSIGMVFQDPMTALNPVIRIGQQITECIAAHHPRIGKAEMRQRAVDLLLLVGIPSPETRLDAYPHQMSGGMRQRIVIAMALANNPKLIIADEPTTALDVTVQAQVLDVMREACEKTGAAVLLITHDMGVVAEFADRVMVFYAGRIVEEGTVRDVFKQPRHPYTRSLLASIPRVDAPPEDDLKVIPGEPPNLMDLPAGCVFEPRCYLANGRNLCREKDPPLRPVESGHISACHFSDELNSVLFEPDKMVLEK